MKVVRTLEELRRARGKIVATSRVGFVPTMGALHAGHRALMVTASAECETVIASLFVNPAQFDDSRDLSAYPRTERADEALAADAGIEWLFVPSAAEIYPAGHATTIAVAGAARDFEGARRPGHFDGVALVCLKLFHLVEPHVVYLGQKDAQQVAVVRQVVRDLNLAIAIRTVPTVRDADGVALSSRNARLSSADRTRAGAIPRALRAGLAAWRAGQPAAPAARAVLGDLDVDYAEVASFDDEPTLVVAVRLGPTRLIDNVPLNRPDLAGL